MNLTLRIWLTVAAVVLVFTTLVLYIVPSQQQKYFLKAFDQEVDNLARTVALGADIALQDENFAGLGAAIDYASKDSRLQFLALLESDTTWKGDSFVVEYSVFQEYPQGYEVPIGAETSEELVIKYAPYSSEVLSGLVMVGFHTEEILDSMHRIRVVAIIVSIVVFGIGILLGLWLAHTISKPVRKIRDAAVKVGQGDLTQQVKNKSRDEIGELSRAFNKMVGDLAVAEEQLQEKNHMLEQQNEVISKEKDRSESLLLNILPAEIAEELKDKGEAQTRAFTETTILFTDFKQFTQLSAAVDAGDLIAELNHCFKAFDQICDHYGIEKIKTIGDAYMAAGGVPVEDPEAAYHTVCAALDMADFIVKRKAEREKQGLFFFEMRTGVNSGPIVAGIVGVRKFQYDIWGDTVNTAARMESSGEVGKVNVSEFTHQLLQDRKDLEFTYRGKVMAKGKGEVDMYFVQRTS